MLVYKTNKEGEEARVCSPFTRRNEEERRIMKKQSVKTGLLIVAFFLGLVLLSYPSISNWLSTRGTLEVAGTHKVATSNLSESERQAEREKAEEYNNSLKGDPVKDPFVPGSGWALPENYKEVLAMDEVMAVIDIPVIDVELPIYHDTTEDVLKKGVGHIPSTALPIGGEGNHSVLTGHTGLPSAKLFTDLIDMKVGDQFYIQVLGEELIYTVDQIKVIKPEDIDELQPVEGKDYVTLVTCTPYGVNSHRLLVRGERDYQMTKPVYVEKDYSVVYLALLIGSSLGALTVVIILVRRWKRLSAR